MSHPDIDDHALDALLHQPLMELADDGFSAAVMARVRALPAQSAALTPAQALRQLQQLRVSAQRDLRCNRYGAAVGIAAALAVLAASGGAPADLAAHGAPLVLALLISSAAVAWALLGEPA